MNVQKMSVTMSRLLQLSLKTSHNRIVACGLFIGLCYLPFWLQDVIVGSIHGSASLLMVAVIALGLQRLWKNRHQLEQLQVSDEDRFLGHLLIFGGIGLAPFFSSSEWSQRLIWLVILAGIACSSWGAGFFMRYPLPTLLIITGFFPQPTVVGKILWETFTPPEMLERFMAWSGGLGLQAIGQPATFMGTIITITGKSVRVDWGCSGFDMATIMAVASLVLGIFLKQSFPKVITLMVMGVILALIANIPRIMLLAMSEAYWGRSAFDFWHGPWGGQIFSTIMFTIYYYIVMAVVKRRSTQQSV
ncbi:MAG TPA: cyanoexosortase C [Trichocoleus sp.]|jgi:exosortase